MLPSTMKSRLMSFTASPINCALNACSHTLAGSETPDGVSLPEALLAVVSLVQFGHVLGEHVLIQVVRGGVRRGLEDAAVLCAPRAPFHGPN